MSRRTRTGGPSLVESLTAPTTDLPQGRIPWIYRPTETEEYLQREIVQIADYLRQQREEEAPRKRRRSRPEATP